MLDQSVQSDMQGLLLFRFLAHWLATLGRSAAASGAFSGVLSLGLIRQWLNRGAPPLAVGSDLVVDDCTEKQAGQGWRVHVVSLPPAIASP